VMASDYQVTWTKKQRERAKADGKALFGVGADSKSGRMETTGLMDQTKAVGLFMFALLLYRGRTPSEAFEGIDWATGGIRKEVTEALKSEARH
jgi:hypothetical protein